MRTTHLPARNQSLQFDPYRLDEITWTRAELLKLREDDGAQAAAAKTAAGIGQRQRRVSW